VTRSTRISYHAASDIAACVAFFMESRMKLANATNPTGNPGQSPGIYATS
jgi:hypothetical protein